MYSRTIDVMLSIRFNKKLSFFTEDYRIVHTLLLTEQFALVMKRVMNIRFGIHMASNILGYGNFLYESQKGSFPHYCPCLKFTKKCITKFHFISWIDLILYFWKLSWWDIQLNFDRFSFDFGKDWIDFLPTTLFDHVFLL